MIGWVAILAVAVITLSVVGLRAAHPFLATTDRVPAPILVVEGWSPRHTLREAASEFRRGHYENVIVVVASYELEGDADLVCDVRESVAQLLMQLDVPAERIHTVRYEAVEKDRTYHSALAVKRWVAEHAPDVRAINVATAGAHARRSRLLYAKALGARVKVGVIALRDRGHDPAHWWRSSEGIREVPFEALAYLYVRFVFSGSE
jgi:hypothetical protein